MRLLAFVLAPCAGCVTWGPGTLRHPHEVDRLDGVYSLLSLESGSLRAVASTTTVQTVGKPSNVATVTIKRGERFEAIGYVAKHSYRFVEMRGGSVILERNCRRTPDAYVIPFLIPPCVIFECDVVAVAPYENAPTNVDKK